jgi:hypothetical protein
MLLIGKNINFLKNKLKINKISITKNLKNSIIKILKILNY